MNVRDYKINRGEMWERLLIIKDKHIALEPAPTEAAATVLIDAVKYVIPVTITSEGGVLLSLTPENTEWFADGEYLWDVAATVSRSALLTSTPLVETVVVHGTLTVSTYDNLSPLASDDNPEALEVLS